MKTVVLFDLDGVLVAPMGYRQAVYEALRRMFSRWGWDLSLPTDLAERYEAVGITSEWDMIPLTLAAALDVWAATQRVLPPPTILDPQGPVPGPWNSSSPPDFAAIPTRLKPYLRPGQAPSETAWHLQATPQALFPRLGRSPLAKALLAHTREVERSPTTRLFQHLTLGSEVFTQTYARPAEWESPSLLQQYDQPLLPPADRARLCRQHRRKRLHLAVFTARPSLPPRGTPPRVGYAPEAEMALDLIHLAHVPLIGFGRLQALAEDRLIEAQAEGILKPHPFHALAALLAALWADEAQALHQAARWLFDGEPPPLSTLPREGIHLVAIEDSATGLRAAQAALDAVQALGIPTQLTLVGVTTHPQKRESLQAVGAQVFPHISAALQQTLFRG